MEFIKTASGNLPYNREEILKKIMACCPKDLKDSLGHLVLANDILDRAEAAFKKRLVVDYNVLYDDITYSMMQQMPDIVEIFIIKRFLNGGYKGTDMEKKVAEDKPQLYVISSTDVPPVKVIINDGEKDKITFDNAHQFKVNASVPEDMWNSVINNIKASKRKGEE